MKMSALAATLSQLPSRHQRDAGGPGRRSPARPGPSAARDTQAQPGDLAGQTQLIEQGGIVIGDPGRQQLAFPGRRRRLVTLQAQDRPAQAGPSLQARLRPQELPVQ